MPWLGVATTLVLFELLTRTNVISSRHFPPPTEMFSALVDQVTTSEFWAAVGHTLEGWALGLAIAARSRCRSGSWSARAARCTGRCGR